MNHLEVLVDQGRSDFKPGQILSGNVRWHLASPPPSLSLQLLWYTSGKGSTDVQRVDSLQIHPPGPSGSEAFRFQLPNGPYSFSGKLISLCWTLELVLNTQEDSARAAFFLSPTGSEIVLPSLPVKPKNFSFAQFKST